MAQLSDEMDVALDTALIEAWDRMSARLKADRVEAMARFRRSRQGMMTRPAREFCLTLRANDLRMENGWGITGPRYACEEREEHELFLPHDSIADLNQAMQVPYPGVPMSQAAAQFGMHQNAFRYWMKHNPVIRVRYETFSGYSRNRGLVPIVWTNGFLHPGYYAGRLPRPMWGRLWHYFGSRVPASYELCVTRVPRWHVVRGMEVFHGWDFLCPGRRDAYGVLMGCGRRCRRLFMPVPAQTINMLLNEVGGFEVESVSAASAGLKLRGTWHPERDPVQAAAQAAGAGGFGFACDHCWRPRYQRMTTPRDAWNAFVATLSGGLLYGKEVAMPAGLIEADGRRRRRQRTLRLVRNSEAMPAQAEGLGRRRVGCGAGT